MKTRFVIESRQDEISLKHASALKNLLVSKGYKEDEVNPELVFSIGGDGTFLNAVNKYFEKEPYFIGIKSGHLGFLCEYDEEDIKNLVDSIDESPLNEISLIKLNCGNKEYFALNEFRIESNNGAVIKFDLFINNDFLESYIGDGICFSSSYGSTGINKSINGPIVTGDLKVLIITPKANINNSLYSTLDNSLVLSDKSTIILNNFHHQNFNIYYDHAKVAINEEVKEIKISLSNKKVTILGNRNYIKNIKDSFLK